MHPVCPACKPWGTMTQQNLSYTYPLHRSWHLLNKVTPLARPVYSCQWKTEWPGLINACTFNEASSRHTTRHVFCSGRLVSLNILHISPLSAETFAASLSPPLPHPTPSSLMPPNSATNNVLSTVSLSLDSVCSHLSGGSPDPSCSVIVWLNQPHGQQNGANPSTLRTFLPHSLFFPLSPSPYLQVKASPFNPEIILPSSTPTISFLLSVPSLTLSFFQCFGNLGNFLLHSDLPSWLHPLSPFSVYCSWPPSLSRQYLSVNWLFSTRS